ncbi:MAG: protease family protein [Solirubrobacteraceae bacterium]|jgi:membrane protease YdiL (CAAX protease family)|nr:protease family protein [Solirubrobacteraceae bacterium]
MVAGFGATLVAGAFVAIIVLSMSDAPKSHDFSPGVNIGLTLFQNLALLGSAFVFARIGGGRPSAEDFGLVKTRLGQAVGLLIAVWFGFYAISTIWALALHLDEKQELPDRLGAGDSLGSTLLVVFLITIVAPLGEELFFRGFFFRALKNWRGLLPGAILTGLVFGAIHLGSSPPAFTVPLAVFGFGLCMLYHWTGSLYPTIALHALNNSLALGVALKWSWEIPVTMVGSVAMTLLIAWSIGRLLGHRHGAARAIAAT